MNWLIQAIYGQKANNVPDQTSQGIKQTPVSESPVAKTNSNEKDDFPSKIVSADQSNYNKNMKKMYEDNFENCKQRIMHNLMNGTDRFIVCNTMLEKDENYIKRIMEKKGYNVSTNYDKIYIEIPKNID